eukprot:GHVT01017999.1.p1 GENE.GHVT01017999.1~~GHVT01017999.1.p1  ORF type:complete len:153 (+),score=26.45 GHVT01017999.1:471-929(+)
MYMKEKRCKQCGTSFYTFVCSFDLPSCVSFKSFFLLSLCPLLQIFRHGRPAALTAGGRLKKDKSPGGWDEELDGKTVESLGGNRSGPGACASEAEERRRRRPRANSAPPAGVWGRLAPTATRSRGNQAEGDSESSRSLKGGQKESKESLKGV